MKRLGVVLLVLVMLAVPVLAAEDGFDLHRLVVGNDGIYFEGDITRDSVNTVIFIGIPGMGVGFRQYRGSGQYALMRLGLTGSGPVLALNVGKEFQEQGGRVLDGRIGLLISTRRAPQFTVGVGLLF